MCVSAARRKCRLARRRGGARRTTTSGVRVPALSLTAGPATPCWRDLAGPSQEGLGRVVTGLTPSAAASWLPPCAAGLPPSGGRLAAAGRPLAVAAPCRPLGLPRPRSLRSQVTVPAPPRRSTPVAAAAPRTPTPFVLRQRAVLPSA